ncbi:MAG: cytotoxic translational repressor of toxin-antitoxin stability system [Planctomycetes bacterium]|nr:cytotoxic translational repressor of toxin-antitoxin stability system [Planctomycetota bacterium]
MFQLTFSDQSLTEVNTLNHAEQLELMGKLSSLTSDILSAEGSHMGRFRRGGKLFHRLRIGELRVYFEHSDCALHCHYILHKNTFNDFVVRCKLPVADERDLEKNQSFWEYLDGLGKKSPR